ncbi:MAG: TIGR03086 family protein [Actinobacteria bacterium]|nr:TIGR03086 family protein [Actinomycetota bacterium]
MSIPGAGLDLPELHAQALAATGRLVAQVKPDQMGRATPCEGWDVRTLLNHVVGGNWWVQELAGGKTIEEVGDRLDGDVLGDDPAGAYDASAAAAAAAFRAPGAMDASCAVSYGPVPGAVYAGHRFVDVLIHGWDLAKGTGQDTTLDPDLVAACWTVVEPQAALLQSSGAFDTDVAAPEGADPQTRLLAALGRRP